MKTAAAMHARYAELLWRDACIAWMVNGWMDGWMDR